MALYVKDVEVDRLAERVASLHGVSKTEAVRRALLHELEREGAQSSFVERGMHFAQTLRARAVPGGQPADKSSIDGLYGEE
ncbi:type II toxin-antitoxin system VapB family antitoxin [Flavisphingomonas formosensis]|uniref:type II toxin-antitoxin system VapB family antitoxin n=1 Tax=Flavisphingomonas formosensis TaxID=861534 RepID=UPI0012FA24FE|nr:type II toxin-antitoxin system VapB family antitoxin [Sphingomonas formosensis]